MAAHGVLVLAAFAVVGCRGGGAHAHLAPPPALTALAPATVAFAAIPDDALAERFPVFAPRAHRHGTVRLRFGPCSVATCLGARYLVVVDGRPVGRADKATGALPPGAAGLGASEIASIAIFQPSVAQAEFGPDGADGALVITTRARRSPAPSRATNPPRR